LVRGPESPGQNVIHHVNFGSLGQTLSSGSPLLPADPSEVECDVDYTSLCGDLGAFSCGWGPGDAARGTLYHDLDGSGSHDRGTI
jgi:hypothetical protein